MERPTRFIEQDQPPNSILGKVRFYYYKVLFYTLGWFLFGRDFTPENLALRMRVDADPILSNAWRLAADAHLLFKKKRYASALALAVISSEEIGKYLLTEWSSDPTFKWDESKKHISKQAAIAALFTTQEVRKKYREAEVDFKHMSDVEMQKLIKAVQDGWKVGKPFETLVINKVYEHVKWSGLYYDANKAVKGIEPAKITKENAYEIMSIVGRAFKALAEDGSIQIARSSYSMVFADYEKEIMEQSSESGESLDMWSESKLHFNDRVFSLYRREDMQFGLALYYAENQALEESDILIVNYYNPDKCLAIGLTSAELIAQDIFARYQAKDARFLDLSSIKSTKQSQNVFFLSMYDDYTEKPRVEGYIAKIEQGKTRIVAIMYCHPTSGVNRETSLAETRLWIKENAETSARLLDSVSIPTHVATNA